MTGPGGVPAAVHRRDWRWPALVFAAGVAGAGAVAAAVGVRASDALTVLVEAVVGAAAAGAVAVLALRLLAGTRLAVQSTVAALAPAVAVAIGVSWAAAGMFITSHDLMLLWIVLAAAGSVGMATALVLARRVSSAAEAVGSMARRLGEDGPAAMTAPGGAGGSAPPRGRAAVPGELAALESELRRSSERLAEAQSRTEALERSRRELVAWVSHDLRTPLAGIRAMVEALEDGVVTDGPTVGRYLATIRLEADRLAGLVDDLFELSRIRAGALELRYSSATVGELLADAVAGPAVAAGAKGVELSLEAEAGLPVVEVATGELVRVVRNLVDNAIRHTPPGGRVTVAAGAGPDDGSSSGPGTVEVSVIDGCGGIPPEDIQRVFETGYKGDPARTPGPAGGGLGLAVAQGLVEAHSGYITVANVPGGCRFTVRIPIRPAQPPAG